MNWFVVPNKWVNVKVNNECTKPPQNCKAQKSKQDISHNLMIDKPATNTISSKIYNPQVNFGTSAKTDK